MVIDVGRYSCHCNVRCSSTPDINNATTQLAPVVVLVQLSNGSR